MTRTHPAPAKYCIKSQLPCFSAAGMSTATTVGNSSQIPGVLKINIPPLFFIQKLCFITTLLSVVSTPIIFASVLPKLPYPIWKHLKDQYDCVPILSHIDSLPSHPTPCMKHYSNKTYPPSSFPPPAGLCTPSVKAR